MNLIFPLRLLRFLGTIGSKKLHVLIINGGGAVRVVVAEIQWPSAEGSRSSKPSSGLVCRSF